MSTSGNINNFSFALRPENHHPSGTVNFSRIDQTTLQLSMNPPYLFQKNISDNSNLYEDELRMIDSYAYYNNNISGIERIIRGMGGVTMSN